MSVTRKALGGVLAATLLATSAAPAMARPWGHGGYGHGGYGYGHRYHRGSGVAGALIGGLVIGGAAVAIGSAIDNDNDRRAYAYNDTPPPQPASTPAIASQGEAVDACSAVAADETRGGQVNDITRAARWADGWQVEGVVDRGTTAANGYRALDRFSCTVRFGEVDDFRIDGQAVALRD
jgi:hypothetical protein